MKACTSSLGGSGSRSSLAALAGSLSGPDQASLPGGPLPSSRRISLPSQVPVCGSAARERRFHRTVRKVGAARTFARPHASSFARPAIRFRGVHPRGCRPPRRWQRPKAFNRCRSAALGHEQKLSLFTESHKRKSPVDKMYNGDKFGLPNRERGAFHKNEAVLPQGRSRYHLVMMYFVPASTGMPWWMLLSFSSPSSRRLFQARRLPARGVILTFALGNEV